MTKSRFTVLTSIMVATAAPAMAQVYSNQPGHRNFIHTYYSPRIRDRIRDYNDVVARRTAKDGGVLTEQDQAMLARRKTQMIAEIRAERPFPHGAPELAE